MDSFTVNGLTIKKHPGNSDYLAQFDVYQGDEQVAYIRFDDRWLTVEKFGKRGSYYYESHIDYSDLAKEIRKATNKINEYLLKNFLEE